MNYPQLWRSSGLAVSLLLTTLAAPRALAAGHTVRTGDTFTAIAKKYNLSVGSLQKANPKINPGVIVKGQLLNLPPTAKSVAPKSTPAVPVKKAAATTDKLPALKAGKKNPPDTATEADRLTATKPVKRPASKTITTYQVQSGDSLTSLARRSGVSVADLVEMNGLDTPDLHDGQKLILPGSSTAPVRTAADQDTVDLTPPARRPREETPSRRSAAPVNPPAAQGTYYHVVKNGDTFSSIARERGVSVAALTKANSTVNPNRLSVNQRINVPGVQVASRGAANDVIDPMPQTRPTAYQADAEETSLKDSAPPAERAAPAGSTRIAYRVTDRDSMDSIAQEFNTTAKELRHLNQMGPFDRLTAGNFVTVPWQETLQ